MKMLLVLSMVVCLTQSASAQNERERQNGGPSAFNLPGVEWSQEQEPKVDELRKKSLRELAKLRQKSQAVFTPEQRRARREALEKASEEGKRGRELRQIAEAAMKLTDQQQKERKAIEQEQRKLRSKIQGELRALLTQEQQQQLRRQASRNQGGRNAIRPTHPNVQYGDHPRQVMDVWLAKSDAPTPVLVSIHGGGFRGGNKSVEPGLLRACLEAKISVVAITYRLSDVAIAPAQFHDAARAVQFIRHKSGEWKLDPQRIAATGGSAGAGLSLWLGFHEDLADPKSSDPVLRESSRLSCMAVYNGQTSYDPRVIRDLFPGTDTYKHPALTQLYDVDLDQLDDLPKAKYELFEEVSAMPHLTKDDAPALLMYASNFDTPIRNQGIGIHHPKFGQVLKEKMDKLGIECQVKTGIRRGDEEFTKLTMEFIKNHLKVK